MTIGYLENYYEKQADDIQSITMTLDERHYIVSWYIHYKTDRNILLLVNENQFRTRSNIFKRFILVKPSMEWFIKLYINVILSRYFLFFSAFNHSWSNFFHVNDALVPPTTLPVISLSRTIIYLCTPQ